MERWQKRDQSRKHYVDSRVDGIPLQARLEEPSQILLVIIGADTRGRMEWVGLRESYQASAQS